MLADVIQRYQNASCGNIPVFQFVESCGLIDGYSA